MKTCIVVAVLGVLLCGGISRGEGVRRASTGSTHVAPQSSGRQVTLVDDSHEGDSYHRDSYGGESYGGNYYGGDTCCNSCGGGGCDACCDFSCDVGCGNSCGNWCDSCCDPCGNGRAFGAGQGFVGGGGVMFLKPHWDNNPAYLAINGNPDFNQDFGYDLQAAPFVWLGYVGCSGFGVRARWFEFDHASDVRQNNAVGILAGGPGQLLSFTGGQDLRFQSDLNLDVWDIEATQSIDVGCTTWIASAGLRYLHIAQHYNVFNSATPGFVSSHNFNGAGPTIALEGRRNIGCTGLSLYGNARGSIVFGDSLYTSCTAEVENTNVRIGSWAPVSIAELEVGAHYSQIVGCSLVYGRVAVVGQHWQGVGNASLSDPTFSGGVDRSNLGLYGVKLELGMNY